MKMWVRPPRHAADIRRFCQFVNTVLSEMSLLLWIQFVGMEDKVRAFWTGMKALRLWNDGRCEAIYDVVRKKERKENSSIDDNLMEVARATNFTH